MSEKEIDIKKAFQAFVDQIHDVMTIDTSQPAENVLAEVKARQIAVTEIRKLLQKLTIFDDDYKPPKKTRFI